MPKNLIRRGNRWFVRVAIPRSDWKVVGRKEIQRTTGTGDLRRAERLKHAIIAAIRDEIEALTAADANPADASWLHRQAHALRRSVQRGELDPHAASDLISILQDQHLKANEETRESATGDLVVRSRTAARVVTQLDFLPLSELLEAYLSEKAPSVEASTIEAKRRAVQLFTDWHPGDTEIGEISRRTCGQFVSDVLASNGRAPKTNRDTVGTLHAFFEWAIRKGRYELANPWKGLAEDLKGSRRGRYSDRKERPWTADEIAAVLNGLPEADTRRRLAVIGLHSGMRLNEICHLQRDNVDLKAGMFTLTEGKTDNAVRQVPIHPEIRGTVSNLLAEESSDGYLFGGLKPGGRDKKRGHSVGRRVNRWLRDNVTKDAGVTMRTTRNTFMNSLENAGVPEPTAKLIVGHARQSLTYGLYSPGVNFELLREAVEKVSFGELEAAYS